MRIKYGNVILAEHGDSDWIVNDVQIGHRRMLQVDGRTRASGVKVKDRKNVQTTVTIQTTRIHATNQEAGIYLLEHEDDLPQDVDLLVIEELSTGGGIARRYLQDAGLEQVNVRRLAGKTTTQDYVLIGGKILKQAPTNSGT